MSHISKRAVASVLFLTGLVFAQGPSRFHPGFNLFSKEQDVQLGQENAAQVRKQMPIVKDPFLTEYVNRVGKKLALPKKRRKAGFRSRLRLWLIRRSTPSPCRAVPCSSTPDC